MKSTMDFPLSGGYPILRMENDHVSIDFNAFIDSYPRLFAAPSKSKAQKPGHEAQNHYVAIVSQKAKVNAPRENS